MVNVRNRRNQFAAYDFINRKSLVTNKRLLVPAMLVQLLIVM